MISSNSRHSVTLRFLAAPTDAGHDGTVDAGVVLQWIDKAAYAVAVGWSKSYCVTVYVGNVHFTAPVHVGEMVEVTASIVYTGSSSMHISTTVVSGDPRTFGDPGVPAESRSHCLVIFVAVDEAGHPHPVPPFVPSNPAEVLKRDHAISRIKVRSDIVEAMSRQEYTDAGSAEKVVLRFLSAPTDVNWGGKVHGGIVMKWIDEAAYVCATRYAGRAAVAVFSGGVRFYHPVLIGDLVEVEARLVYTGHKGMHIAVLVRSGDPATGELDLATYCLTVMVIRDETGTAVPVTPWVPVTDEDIRLAEHARELLHIRGLAPGNRLPNHLLDSVPAGGAPHPAQQSI